MIEIEEICNHAIPFFLPTVKTASAVTTAAPPTPVSSAEAAVSGAA